MNYYPQHKIKHCRAGGRRGEAPISLFEYIAVIVAVIIGLGLTRILEGFEGLLKARGRVTIYWVHLLFVAVVFLAHLLFWWLFWSSRTAVTWSFFPFLFLLLQPVILYLLAGLCFPSFTKMDVVDLRAFYYDNHRWFFALLALLMVLITFRDLVFLGTAWFSLQSAVKVAVLLIAIAGAVWRDRRLHSFLAVSSFVIICAAVAIFGMQLR